MDPLLRRRALLLSYLTVVYNVVEGAVSVFFAALASSPALLGFALDSFIESVSGGIMIWRFGQPEGDEDQEEIREQKAYKLVGWTFLGLGAYVLYEALEKLYNHEASLPSLGGIIIAVLSLIIMPWLAHRKIAVATALGSASLLGDAKETLACAWLSVALLLGLGLNYLLHWWWADPVAGLIIVFFLWREGLEMIGSEIGTHAGCGCGCRGASEPPEDD
ncbi:MAG: cation transporter [Bacteroidota bacterium]